MADASQTVLVTGASGFIATHIIQQLQQAGYKVRGTVRSTQNEEKVKPLRELAPGATYPLELVEADLTKSDGWKEAVTGCTYVLHTASPFPIANPKNENEVIGPAVDGTKFVLKACQEAGGVKRVVLTSSAVAVSPGTPTAQVSEVDWTDVNKTSLAYIKSKTLAEKAAWDFVADLPDDEKFELAVINPSLVFGPILATGGMSSMEIPKRLLEHKVPAVPRVNFTVVDVRDVAAAHVAAMTEPNAAGNRHIVSSDNLWFKDMARIFEKEFKPLGYKIPTKEAPLFLVKCLGLFDKAIKTIIPLWGKEVTYDNSRMTNVLKVQPRAVETTLNDMGHSLIERGFVKKTSKYQKAKGAGSEANN